MGAAIPGSAAASHEDCAIVIKDPFLSYGIFAEAGATVTCQSAKNNITISAELLRDGVEVTSVIERSHKYSEWFAHVVTNDAAGDQTWCVRVWVRINPHRIGPETRCAIF